MAIADLFVKPVSSCDINLNAGSLIYVSKLNGCNLEPRLYTVSVPAIALNAITANMAITAVSDDGVAVTPLTGISMILKKGQILYATLTTPVIVAQDTTITSVAAAVPIEPAAVAVTAGSALVWDREELTTVTDVPLSLSSTTENSTVLRNGLQGSTNKTKVELTVALQLLSSNRDLSIQRVIAPAAQGSENIYVVIAKSSGYTAIGRSKVSDLNISGAREGQEEISCTLNFQAPFGLYFATLDTTINTTVQIAGMQNIVKYVGLPNFD
jgi:hypothetical protein